MWVRSSLLSEQVLFNLTKNSCRIQVSSPRMPRTLSEIFKHVHLLDFKTATGPGVDSGASSSIVTCAASQARSQRPVLLQAAAETTACTGKEYLKAVRRVRHYKEVGLQEWPLAGRATVPRVLYGIGLRMSLRRRTILSKRLRALACVDLTIHTFCTVDRTAGRRFVREEVIIWWQSRGLEICTTAFML